MKPHTVYMDYHATTPVDPRVLESMLPWFTENFGNPASRQHRYGWAAEEAVDRARTAIAGAIGADPREIVFTSGATEANNLAIRGTAAAAREGGEIVTVRTEHSSVLDVCGKLGKRGVRVVTLDVDGEGLVDPRAVREALTDRTIIVSVMLANNEIGTIQPLAEIGEICRAAGVLFHTDATQAVGKIPVDVASLKVDLLSFSAHKVYGPKGTGCLYVRRGRPAVRIVGQIDGGGHEGGLRSGTLNVPGIVGCAKAVELAVAEMGTESRRLAALRDGMLAAWTGQPGGVSLNGHPVHRLPNNLNVSFAGVDNDVLMMNMKDVAVSSGSACTTGKPEPSHVLSALGFSPERVHSSIRLGLGRFTTDEDARYVTRRVAEEVARIRAAAPPKKTGAPAGGTPRAEQHAKFNHTMTKTTETNQ